MYVHMWIARELSTAFCASLNTLQLILSIKADAVAKHLLKTNENKANPQKKNQHLISSFLSICYYLLEVYTNKSFL